MDMNSRTFKEQDALCRKRLSDILIELDQQYKVDERVIIHAYSKVLACMIVAIESERQQDEMKQAVFQTIESILAAARIEGKKLPPSSGFF